MKNKFKKKRKTSSKYNAYNFKMKVIRQNYFDFISKYDVQTIYDMQTIHNNEIYDLWFHI